MTEPGNDFKRRPLRWIWTGTYVLFMAAPVAVWSFLHWRVYASSRAATLSALIAIPACLAVVGGLLHAHARWIAAEDPFGYRFQLVWPQLAVVWLWGYLSSWAAVFLVLVAATVHQGNGSSNRVYHATRIEECSFKCNGCRLRASLRGDPAITGRVCVEDVRPAPKAGDAVTVVGHFFREGVYIEAVRHAVESDTVPSH